MLHTLRGKPTTSSLCAFVTVNLIFIGGIVTGPAARAFQSSNAQDAELAQVANQLVEALNWTEAKDITAVMTPKGMAEFCIQQFLIVRQPHAVYQDPAQTPDMSRVEQLFSAYDIDWDLLAEASSIFAKPDIETNLRTRPKLVEAACGELTKQTSPERLAGLTDALCRELANLESKPSTFEIHSIVSTASDAMAAVALKGTVSLPSTETDKFNPVDSQWAASHCKFTKKSGVWLFDGFDSEKTLEQQVKLLKSLDLTKVYVPQELRDTNLLDCTNRWSISRSRQSDHCIVFWDKGYGHLDPSAEALPAKFRVDIDDLLTKADQYFETNVAKLKFADVREGESQLSKYKLQIFLLHTEDWVAAGAGSDDVVGGLWVSPNACQPVGSTVAHEIGHCFQYQVHCDLKGKHGFRYGFGGKGGNAFWEQSAQWQALQDFPKEIFGGHDFVGYQQNYHRHFHHEDQRYSSYFLLFYWQQKHGDDILARIWRGAIEPEDPIQSYMRLTVSTFPNLMTNSMKRPATL